MLDDPGLSIQAHGFVGGRVVLSDAVAALGDQLLDQLGAGSLVLDQHDTRIKQALLLAHAPQPGWGFLWVGRFDAPAPL
jgi:hypothetical protein